jgi:hypothetical protein
MSAHVPTMKAHKLLSLAILAVSLARGQHGAMAAAPEETDPEIKSFREHSRARIAFTSGASFLEVFIHADDEKMEILRADSCSGKSGSKRYRGTYRIVTFKNRAFHAARQVGKRVFTESRGEEIREIRFPESSGRLISISQYQNCAGDAVEFFRVDGRGGLHKVPVRDKEGSEKPRLAGGPGGQPDHILGNQLTYCRSAGSQGAALCIGYVFDGNRLIRASNVTHEEAGQKRRDNKAD